MAVIDYGNGSDETLRILESAREMFGNFNQILVSIEELNELSAIIAKIPRYKNTETAVAELHDKILDETADVLIVLDHIIKICEFSDTEIQNRIHSKIDRMRRWLENAVETESTSLQQITLVDREVQE